VISIETLVLHNVIDASSWLHTGGGRYGAVCI
jgi:hypothetical protein